VLSNKDDAKRVKCFLGICLERTINLTHLLFVDDILIFCSCAEHNVVVLKEALAMVSKATGMIINGEKYVIYLVNAQGPHPPLFDSLLNFSIHALWMASNILGLILSRITMGQKIGGGWWLGSRAKSISGEIDGSLEELAMC
jgi:hypothetical protein